MELVKREDHWALYNEDGHKIAATIPGCNSKLSIKNCEAIANGYDLDELASERLSTRFDENSGYHKFVFVEAYKEGFQKALEILGDKKFSEKDMYGFADYSWKYSERTHPTYDEKSLQQTEFDVEIVTELAYCKKGESGCKVYDQTKNSKDVFNLIYHCDGQIEGRFIHRESTGLKPTCVGYSKPVLDKDSCLILKRI